MKRISEYKVILGSASEGRREVFKKFFKDFTTMPSYIDEEREAEKLGDYKNNPIILTMFLSYKKNLEIRSRLATSDKFILITFDTVVVHQGEIKFKPKNKEIARTWFYSYRNDFQEIVTSYALYVSDIDVTVNDFDISVVYLKNIPDEEIERYIQQNPVEAWSGGIAIERTENFFEIVEGVVDSIIGAPMKKIIDQLNLLIS
ncbi:MAG: Maf family protein [Brevinematia bacterium]